MFFIAFNCAKRKQICVPFMELVFGNWSSSLCSLLHTFNWLIFTLKHTSPIRKCIAVLYCTQVTDCFRFAASISPSNVARFNLNIRSSCNVQSIVIFFEIGTHNIQRDLSNISHVSFLFSFLYSFSVCFFFVPHFIIVVNQPIVCATFRAPLF